MKVIELECPERFGVKVLPRTAELKRRDGYSLVRSFQTKRLDIIQEIAEALGEYTVSCDITSFTNPEDGSNVYNLWAKANFTFSVRFVYGCMSVCRSCVNLEIRQEGRLWRCRRIDLMERELGEKVALLQMEATFRGECQECNYFEQGHGETKIQ